MVNKRKFSIQNMKKVLHKHGKQWIVVSAALLMMLGGSAMATKISHADANHAQPSAVKVAPNNNQKQATVATQAKQLHSQILNNANQKSVTQNQTQLQNSKALVPKSSANVAVPARKINTGSSMSNLQKLQMLYKMYEALVKSGIFSDSTNNNQPVQPSDNQPVTNTKYLGANSDADIFNNTSDFNKDISDTEQPNFNVVDTTDNPAVNVIGNASVKGFNFDHISDTNNSNDNGWVFSDALSNNQGNNYNYKQELRNFLNALQNPTVSKYLVQNSNNDSAFIFNDTNNFKSDVVPTLMFHDVSDPTEPSVKVIGSTNYDGFNLDRISDASDSSYNGWVLSDQLNSDKGQKANSQTLVNFLNAIKNPSNPVNSDHKYLINSDDATPIFSDVDNISDDFQDPNHPLYAEISNSIDPLVHIIKTASYDGYNFDRISDSNNHNYDGWVLSDALSNNQGSAELYGDVQNLLDTVKSNAKPSSDSTNTRYVLSASDMLDNSDFSDLQNGQDYSVTSDGDTNVKVNVTNQQTVDGYTFDYIQSPDAKDNDVWVYSGDLGTSTNSPVSDVDLGHVQSDIIYKYVSDHQSDFSNSIRKELFKDINSDRYNYYGANVSDGYQNIREDYFLDDLAQTMAEQAANASDNSSDQYSDWADPSDQFNSDANNINLSLNTSYDYVYGYTTVSKNFTYKNDPNSYDTTNGEGLADSINDDNMNYNNDSIKQHILSPTYTTMGIGAAYNPSNHKFYTVEVLYRQDQIIGH